MQLKSLSLQPLVPFKMQTCECKITDMHFKILLPNVRPAYKSVDY